MYAPLKIKYITANNSPFTNKKLSKTIINRPRLRHNFPKFKTPETRDAYKKQSNCGVSFLRGTKIWFYENLNPSVIAYNKTFWKQVKPFSQIKRQSILLLPLRSETILFPTRLIGCAEIMNICFTHDNRTLHINSEVISENTYWFEAPPRVIKTQEIGYIQTAFQLQLISRYNN